jgi:leader peptidase (prepilin peptidase) / N-methyltransferase
MVMVYLLILLFGLALGSFLNVCISRIPQNNSVVFPASYCPACHTNIRKRDNIPIFSFLLLRGKCRNCRTKIPIYHIIVEILTPLLFIALFWVLGSKLDLIFFKYVIFISFGLILFFIDLHHRLLPDKLTLPLIVVGLILALLPGSDVTAASAFIASFSGFGLFLLLAYVFQLLTGKDALGGGDIKLIAAIGMFVGIFGLFFVIIMSSALALLTLLLIKHDLKKEFPFGPFLIAATFIYISFGQVLIRSYLDFFN